MRDLLYIDLVYRLYYSFFAIVHQRRDYLCYCSLISGLHYVILLPYVPAVIDIL
jgi:hypothetical protein